MILPYTLGTPVRLVSGYGVRIDPITYEAGVPHWGYDLVGDGDKTIRAVASGTVGVSTMLDRSTDTTSTWEWGNYVRVDGDDGLYYYYCHMSERLVTSGMRIESGQAIGIEGSTGKSTGSHLHLEIREKNGKKLDPSDVIGVPNVIGTYTVTAKENSAMEKEKKLIDSEPNEWAKDAVEWAVENEIIFGNQNGDLMLRQSCTREQMLVFLHRFAQSIGKA